ncbi:hypothetical protein TNCV_680251, partial [Trichonephila clavipes]
MPSPPGCIPLVPVFWSHTSSHRTKNAIPSSVTARYGVEESDNRGGFRAGQTGHLPGARLMNPSWIGNRLA